MTRRPRLLAGILTLAALTFSLAETVVASTCAPMRAKGSIAMAGGTDTPADDCMAAPDGKHPERGGEGPFHCPFGPMTAAQVCTAAPSLPAPVAHVDESSSSGLASSPFDDAGHDVLLVTALFHPPKP